MTDKGLGYYKWSPLSIEVK